FQPTWIGNWPAHSSGRTIARAKSFKKIKTAPITESQGVTSRQGAAGFRSWLVARQIMIRELARVVVFSPAGPIAVQGLVLTAPASFGSCRKVALPKLPHKRNEPTISRNGRHRVTGRLS